MRWLSLFVLALATQCATAPSAPTNVGSEPELSRPQATEEVLRGERLLVHGRVAEAQQIFERAIDEDPRDARAWLDLGLTHEAMEKTARAMSAYERASQIDPGFAEAFNNLGVLQRDAGDLSAATTALERAVELDPDLSAAHFNLGLAYEEAGRIEEAEREYLATIAQLPGDPVPRINLAMMYLDAGRSGDAAAQLRASVPSVAEDVLLSIAVGEGLRRAKVPAEAVPVLRSALEVAGEPAPTELLAELGLSYYAVGDLDSAERYMARALRQNEVDPALQYAYGSILAKQGRIGEARAHLRRAGSLDPEGPYAERARARLKALE